MNRPDTYLGAIAILTEQADEEIVAALATLMKRGWRWIPDPDIPGAWGLVDPSINLDMTRDPIPAVAVVHIPTEMWEVNEERIAQRMAAEPWPDDAM